MDIFDEYYDKLKERGGLIKEIKSGFGKIKPKLYGKIKDGKLTTSDELLALTLLSVC